MMCCMLITGDDISLFGNITNLNCTFPYYYILVCVIQCTYYNRLFYLIAIQWRISSGRGCCQRLLPLPPPMISGILLFSQEFKGSRKLHPHISRAPLGCTLSIANFQIRPWYQPSVKRSEVPTWLPSPLSSPPTRQNFLWNLCQVTVLLHLQRSRNHRRKRLQAQAISLEWNFSNKVYNLAKAKGVSISKS